LKNKDLGFPCPLKKVFDFRNRACRVRDNQGSPGLRRSFCISTMMRAVFCGGKIRLSLTGISRVLTFFFGGTKLISVDYFKN